MWLTGIISILILTLSEDTRERNTFQLIYEASVTLIPKPDTDITRKKNTTDHNLSKELV